MYVTDQYLSVVMPRLVRSLEEKIKQGTMSADFENVVKYEIQLEMIKNIGTDSTKFYNLQRSLSMIMEGIGKDVVEAKREMLVRIEGGR